MLKKFSIPTDAGQTRLCLDPWAKFLIKANGDVWLCCNSTKVGNIKEEKLNNILNNDETKSYRAGLLHGNLNPICKYCHEKPACTTLELHQAVNDYYEKNKYI